MRTGVLVQNREADGRSSKLASGGLSLSSSVVEQPPCKRQVGGSNPFSGSSQPLGRTVLNGKARSRVLILSYGLLFVVVAAFVNYLFERRFLGPVFLGLASGNALYVALGLVLPRAFPNGLLTLNREGRIVLGITLGVAMVLLALLLYGVPA